MQIRLLYRKVMIADDTSEERKNYQIAGNCHWKIPATCHTTRLHRALQKAQPMIGKRELFRCSSLAVDRLSAVVH